MPNEATSTSLSGMILTNMANVQGSKAIRAEAGLDCPQCRRRVTAIRDEIRSWLEETGLTRYHELDRPMETILGRGVMAALRPLEPAVEVQILPPQPAA